MRVNCFWRWLLALTLSGLCLVSAPFSVRAAEVVVPLTIHFDFLTQALARQLYTAADGRARVWHEGPCRYLYLDRPQFRRQQEYLHFTSHGVASVGTEVLQQCLSPLNWRGFVEVLMTPYLTPHWQLRFRLQDSNLYDENWNKGLLTGPIWDVAERFFLPHLTGFVIDLSPPREEILSLVQISVPPSETVQIETILRSVQAKKVELTNAGVVVHVALTVPDRFVQEPLTATQPEAPLTPAELHAYQTALAHWDAFIVFVVKGLGLDVTDAPTHAELFEFLLISRYALLPILAGDVTRGAGDPVRRLFVEAWSRLREIILKAEHSGLLQGKILRYAAFVNAGDALLAIDRAAPGLGIEISADGLRRLARILQPEAVEDPLTYSLEVDPTLRTLFGFSSELEPVLPSPSRSHLGWTAFAYAARETDEELAPLRERLDRWVPEASELAEYRSVVDKLLQLTTDQRLQDAFLQPRYVAIYRTLVPTTALQESCWRQFTRKGKKVTYLSSTAGSVGLMQVNWYVWRGFYDVENLRWNPVYNAQAGAEILIRYLQKYGREEAKRTGKVENAARATWAVYNGGPKAVKRYRSKRSSPREKRVDSRFWSLYRGFVANGRVDLNSCSVRA